MGENEGVTGRGGARAGASSSDRQGCKRSGLKFHPHTPLGNETILTPPPPQTHKVTVLGRAGGFTLVRMVIASRTVLNIPDDILITQTQKLKNMLLIPSETEKTQKVNCP